MAKKRDFPGLDAGWYERMVGGGIFAGIVMAMIMMIVAVSNGQSLWAPVQLIANTIPSYRDANMGFQLGPVLVGIMIHMVMSATWGFAYAFVAPRLKASKTALFWIGIASGVVAYLVMMFLIVPWANPTMLQAPQGWFFFAHLMFGGVLGAVGAFEKNYLFQPHRQTRTA